MKTIIVWFRNDLRLTDNPALWSACKAAERVIPLFILDPTLLGISANRTRFLLEALDDLKSSLKGLGGDLIIRSGKPSTVLSDIAKEFGVNTVYFTSDYTPFALKRDKAVELSLSACGVTCKRFPGRLAVDDLDSLSTKTGTPHKVFTPFYKQWLTFARRPIVPPPSKIKLPDSLEAGHLPDLNSAIDSQELSANVVTGGENMGRTKLHDFLEKEIFNYQKDSNDLAKDSTSHLSAYLHFGCLSIREIESLLPESEGAIAWHRQLAWREFYTYILYKFPNPDLEFQEKYRKLKWSSDQKRVKAWQEGRTGYPVVDAAMRQLKQEGWMHNRARLIVGSFLTKDLWVDWRVGEAYFYRWLVDGDKANNNGNWQWIASVGVDPAPVYRRLYNPSSQRDRFDPDGQYIRNYLPELSQVPDKYLNEPWKMDRPTQEKVGCIIGEDYPLPIVDHKVAREEAFNRFKKV